MSFKLYGKPKKDSKEAKKDKRKKGQEEPKKQD